MATKRLAPDRSITQRRQEEEKRAWYTDQVKQETNSRHYANWVNSTHEKIQHKGKMQLVEEMHEMHSRTVEERRERLCALLAAEQEEYFKALDNMVETQDARKQRLAAAALDLRQRREDKRAAIARQKADQAFKDNCDPLRTALSKQTTMQVAVDRQQQLQWAEARKHEEEEDDRIFAEMWEQERLKKVVRAQEDMEKTRTMNEKLKVQLAAQKDAFHQVKQREKELQQQQDALYKEQVEFQLAYDAQKERERRAQAVALGRANKEFNNMLRAEKEEKMRQKRSEDIRELDALLAKIRAEEEADHRLKMARQAATQKFMEELKEHMGTEAANEAEMEHLWQLENEKQWAKREAQWQKDQEARDRLLRDVYEERAKQIQLKISTLGNSAKEKAQEKEQLLREMEAALAIEAEKKADAMERNRLANLELDRQVALREDIRANAKREVEMEKIQSEIAEEQFKVRVAQELQAVEDRTRAIRMGRAGGSAGQRPF
mmetsp:Transcript_37660/g.67193  ORF Transcript_37660/g.67193 Transcript_37660/m.67193 type:complete len:491 (-) Transcript_37660:897-2369(-)